MTVEVKVITQLWLLHLVIGFKISRRFFQAMRFKTQTNRTVYARFSRARSKLQVIARNSNWFIALFVHFWLVGVKFTSVWFFDSFGETDYLRKPIVNGLDNKELDSQK